VLFEVSARFPAGQVTVVAGRSGCGKTTLLRNMLGLIRPQAGSIRVFGRDLGDMTEEELLALRPHVGVLFQQGALLQSYTVGENVAIPLERHTNLPQSIITSVVRRKLQLVELGGTDRLRPSELSGGMKRRAALARALALDPEVLFFDEPTAGLDPVTAAALDRLILRLRRTLGITVVAVTHELTSIRRIADRMLFIHEGRAVFEGSIAEAERSEAEPVRAFFRYSEPQNS